MRETISRSGSGAQGHGLGIRRIFGCAFWLTIDNFWLLLRCNLLALLITLPVLTFPLALAGILGVCEKLTTTKEAHWGDFLQGVKHLAGRCYLWSLSAVLLWIWCIVSLRFYATRPPLVQSMGCTITLVITLGAHVFGFLLLPRLARLRSWKESLRTTGQLILERPLQAATFCLGILGVEFALLLTGLGFLAAGCSWPLLAGLCFEQPPYTEDRTWKDFLFPRP